MFAEFYAPLVEAVDARNDALYSVFVFEHDNQVAHVALVDLIHDYEVKRAVAGVGLVRDQLFDARLIHSLRFEFGADFVRGFAAHKGFCLGEDVGKHDFVVSWHVPAFFKRCDWVDGGNVRALVQQLEEGVLSVDARFAADNRRGFVSDCFAVQRNLFADAFHIELLDEFGQAVEVLVVRCDDVASAAVVVDVPDADKGEDGGQVALELSVDEMLVHQVRAVEHFDEVFFAEMQHNLQSDGGPQSVTTADPVPKFKHIGGVDAEFGNGFLIVGNSGEMFGDGVFVACMIQKPFARGQRVGQRFLRGKGFGGDNEQRGFGVDFGQYVAQLRAVHVGDEVHIEAWMTERFERGTHHQRAQIRSADADVDNVGNDLVGIAQPASTADFVCKFAHTLQNAVDFWHHIFTVNHNRRIGAVAKGDVRTARFSVVLIFRRGTSAASAPARLLHAPARTKATWFRR